MVNTDCDYMTTLLLALFFGIFGGHRFYTQKYGTAVLYIVLLIITWGIGNIIWLVVDLVSITNGSFTNKKGARLINHPRWDS